MDEYLNWSPYINHLSQKLVKANALFCKLQHFVNVATIKSIYYTIFHSHLSYVCTAWGQNLNSKHHINLLQKEAIWIISFDPLTLFGNPYVLCEKNITYPLELKESLFIIKD